ncbi:MAG: TonB family protein [Acidobacteriaceae bacterium]
MRSVESWLLSYLVNSFWQAPLLFVAGWIAARLLRKTGAAAEHRVWVGVLLLQSLLPAFSIMPWQWLGTHFAWGAGVLRPGNAHVSVVMGAGSASSAVHLPAALLAAVAIVYLATSAYFAARFIWQWRRLRAIRLDATKVVLTGEAAVCWSQCSKRFGIDGAGVAASSCIFGPVTMGWARKLVLLPAGILFGLPEDDIHTVITHEFAHMRRNDFLKNVLYELLALPVSYHPVSWLTREFITESREVICDQMAAEIGGRIPYARSLLRLASLLVAGMPARNPHAIGIFDTNTFERRLMKLTEKRSDIRGARRLVIVIACVVFGLGTCGSALALSMHVDAATSAGNNSASKKATPLRVSPEVMAGQRMGGTDPKYPAAAKKAKIQGTVVLKAIIGKDGSVKKVTVVSGPKELRKSSVDAVRTWKYKPFLLNGDPVEVETQVNVVYSLGK